MSAMNMLTVACPQCRTKYQVRPEHAGRSARCAKCNATFTVMGPPPNAVEVPQPKAAANLVSCPYCGFQDYGNFCSMCGARLGGKPTFDFLSCKVPDWFMSQLPSCLTYDIDAPPAKTAEQQRLFEVRQNCQQFNREIEELARAVRCNAIVQERWRFDRVQIDRLVALLSQDVPARDQIVMSLSTAVSDVERAIEKAELQEVYKEAEGAVKNADIKKATKCLNWLLQMAGPSPDEAISLRVGALRKSIEDLERAKDLEAELLAFQKLRDKADKLVFQEEYKKAIKAYQECIFWLSRHEVPNRDRLHQEIEQSLAQTKTQLPQ